MDTRFKNMAAFSLYFAKRPFPDKIRTDEDYCNDRNVLKQFLLSPA